MQRFKQNSWVYGHLRQTFCLFMHYDGRFLRFKIKSNTCFPDKCFGNILNSLDEGLEVKGVFLDIPKAFDKIWHKGLIYKSQQSGNSGESLNILIDFLNNRKQRNVLNGQSSNWVDVKAVVPQGSIMGVLLFLNCINDLPEGLITNAKLFRDIAANTKELSNSLRNISK